MLKIHPKVFWAFFVGLFLPVYLSIDVGIIRLTLYRIAIIIFILGSMGAIIRACRPSLSNPSFLITAYASWAVMALMVNHGFALSVETGGVYFIEVIGPYFIALAFIHNEKRLDKVVYAYLIAVALSLLVTVPECLTGLNWLKITFGQGTGGLNKRMGLHRAFGLFNHPILQGVVASTAMGLAWFTGRYKLFYCAMAAAVTSVSSGVMVSIFTQLMLIGWERYTKNVKKRWLKLLIILLIGYLFIELASNRSGIRAILTNATMSSHTAYWRMLIWEFGMQNAYDNPFFGIGLHEWERPAYMYSGSMDAFWLVHMVRYGFPSFFLYAGAFLLVIFKLLLMKTNDKPLNDLRRGWLTGMVGLATVSTTVHLWNNAFVLINFYLGIGVALMYIMQRRRKEELRQMRSKRAESDELTALSSELNNEKTENV